MKTRYTLCLLTALLCARPAAAQVAPTKRPVAAGDYAADLATVVESLGQALDQAKQMWGDSKNPEARDALQTAIKAMESANSCWNRPRRIRPIFRPPWPPSRPLTRLS